MLSVDTNVVVRYLTADDRVQSPAARRLIDGNDILLLTSVALETEWVLRSAYGLSAAEIRLRLAAFAGLPTVSVQEPQILATALAYFQGGMDFADALHVAGGAGCEAFVSFDQRLVRRAKALGVTTVRAP